MLLKKARDSDSTLGYRRIHAQLRLGPQTRALEL